MKKRVVLITGGSSGIGKAIGNFLSSRGYIVYGTSRNLDQHKDFQDFQLLQLDVRDQQSINKAVKQIIDEQGSIDIVINNAGIGITGPLEETPVDAIANVFDINFSGPMRVIKTVLPFMRQQQSGLIVNITSIAGYMGLPFRGAYSASKGALELLTEAYRMEIKNFGVNMVNLAPGDFATNIASGRYTVEPNEDSPYYKNYKMSLDLMNAHVDDGGDPKMVAMKVWQIINAKNPKGHYRVGDFMQRFSIVLKKILPSKVFEKLLLRHYKI
ncbi:SDR family oxidoreductase [Croceivirga thetidis]|uniref:SDR family oxidoreductase n=1 Tax=Croceivirga thetidis TaxID=2721623 RepID=A0ABX1GRG0_9FLAO|nr:SDR family oxidoreductase [Croceivirga thetidis]NKI32525.1 SDR family oxidoreductase [Croceivirga thetidis]